MNKKRITGFEISVLVIAIFSFSYFVFSSQGVSAQTVTGCCEETDSGARCQVVEEDECMDGFSQFTSCSDTQECRLGCCISGLGTCSPNSPKSLCEDGGGNWQDDATCSVPSCEKACCVLGSQAQFVTETECDALSSSFNLEKDFRQEITTELECFLFVNTQLEGACVFEQSGEELCVHRTRQECEQISGSKFNAGGLCSFILKGKCLQFDHKGCVDGRDEVYWFDSCGNKEEVVVGMECSRLVGTTCDYDENGEAYCKDLNCHDIDESINGGDPERNHGESWCVYEGYVGDGKDVPGTSHYRYICLEGEIIPEMCKPGRQEICVETTNINGVSTGDCIPNYALYCLYLNSLDAVIRNSRCEDNPHCSLVTLSAGGLDLNPDATFCQPNYPFATTEGNACDLATYQCLRSDEEKWGDWECERGCHCNSPVLIKRLGDFCASLGDCGAFTSPAGEVTDRGFYMTFTQHEEDPGFFGIGGDEATGYFGPYYYGGASDYAQYADVFSGQKISPGSFDYLMDDPLRTLELVLPSPVAYELSQTDFYNSIRTAETIGGLIFFKSPWFWTISIVLEVVRLFGGGERTFLFTYSCGAWEPPVGGINCENCNLDPDRCTRYKCSSLGQACVFQDDNGDGFGECYRSDPGDISAPLINPIDSPDLEFSDVSEAGFVLKEEDSSCVDQFEILNLGLQTNERARCRYDFEDKEFSQLRYLFEREAISGVNHTTEMNFAYEEKDEVRLYVRCMDVNGNYNEISYLIDICIEKEDLMPPQRLSSDPLPVSYLEFGKEETNLSIFLNEPSRCRWSREDKDYEVMENEFVCGDIPLSLPSVAYTAWSCVTKIGELDEDENEIYVRCEDSSENLNRNSEGTRFLFKKSDEELRVDILSPVGEIVSNEEVNIELRAKTDGGANGEARCEYSFAGFNGSTLFFSDIYGMIEMHVHPLDEVPEGDYVIDVECVDSAGNIAKNQTNFSVVVDREVPKVTRAYNREGSLVVITNEFSECSYDLRSCQFEFEDGIMMNGNEYAHTILFDEDRYYVKCRDGFDNVPGDCNIVINRGV